MLRLPPPRLEHYTLSDHRVLTVLRDDELAGGSKRRVLGQLMCACWPEEEFVFGGPAQGYAQVALAYSAADAGKRATFFIAQRKQPHPLTQEAMEAGARIVQVPAGRLAVVQRRAKDYAATVGARFLPLGFDLPEFRQALTIEAMRLDLQPSEVWCTAGSGALSRALQVAWPNARHHAVRIGFPPEVGDAVLWEAPELFSERAEQPPPFPSCAWYDAKAWRFVSQHARDGALFWNVAA